MIISLEKVSQSAYVIARSTVPLSVYLHCTVLYRNDAYCSYF